MTKFEDEESSTYKPSISLREIRAKLLSERCSEKNSLDENRAAKLREMLVRLRSGENIQNRMLETWLMPIQYAEINERWNNQKLIRQELQEKPDEIKRYEQKIKRADFTYNKAEGYSQRGNHTAARKLFANADSLYENAYGYLEEIVGADSSLLIWFDRNIALAVDNDNGFTPANVPRVITSKSINARSSARHTCTKRDVKIAVLEQALQDFEHSD